jgi:hypothetical protein
MREHFPSVDGAVFPHVSRVCRHSGIWRAADIQHALHASIAGGGADASSTARSGGGILVANLTGETQEIKIKSGTSPARVRYLDETNFEQATRDPEGFRKEQGVVVQPVTAKIELKMLPFAVARVDIQ